MCYTLVSPTAKPKGSKTQGLEVIIRNNAKAVEEHALKTRNTGNWGLAKYVGLNFHSFAEFDTEAERNAATCDWTNEAPGRRTASINPTTEA